MDVVTIDGSVALTVARAAKALDCGRSTVYRRIASGELEVVRFDGRPKITARSILKLLGLTEDAHAAATGETLKPEAASAKPAVTRAQAAARPSHRRRRIKGEAQ
jgi:excisionase family DNA binding protein